MPRMTLDGKTALMTGGARRVGRAIVEELARAGCRVVIHHASSDAEAAALAARWPRASYTPATVRATCASAPPLGCWSTPRSPPPAARHPGQQRRRLRAHAAGDAERRRLGRHAGAQRRPRRCRLMREASAAGVGAIVNIVDVAAWQPWANWSAYATSKAALLHLSRCLALELAPRTRVNCVAPGTVIFPDDWDEARRAAMLRENSAGARRRARRRGARRSLPVRGGVSHRRVHARRRRRRIALR